MNIIFYCLAGVTGMFIITSLFIYFFIHGVHSTRSEDKHILENAQRIGEQMETDIEIQKWIAFCVSIYNKNMVLEREKAGFLEVSKFLMARAIMNQEALKLS